MSEIEEDLIVLQKALFALPATGTEGFEGLLRDLLGAVTGCRFRLVKSGHQAGIDVLGDQPANGVMIGLESKHYGSDTRLPFDQLKAKLLEAISSRSGMDLWILATTRDISADDRAELIEIGTREGVAVEVIDWPEPSQALPPLAVLAAAAPNVIEKFCDPPAAVLAALAAIEKDPRFPAERERLGTRLSQADIGYDNARRRLAEWIRDSMTDRQTARANLGSYAELREPSMRRVRRAAIDSKLDDWWKDKPADHPIALLGGEGLGKTWSFLSWWDSREEADPAFPLTVFISARHCDLTDIEAIVAHCIAQRTGIRDEKFWSRRLQRWLRSSPKRQHPILLLTLDGLNERWRFRQWRDALQPLFAGHRAGKYGVLLTDRPDHWNTDLRKLLDLAPQPRPLNIHEFSKQELTTLLEAYGLRLADFSEEVRQLMAVPRLCKWVIQMRESLHGVGDITRERLIYEDWRRRLELRGADLAIDDDELRDLVASLGKRLRDSAGLLEQADKGMITRAELVATLGKESGANRENLEATLSELIDGRWLESVDGRVHRLRLRAELVPFALGLALANTLRNSPAKEPDAIRECLAEFLDPLRGQDIGTAILRATATTCVLDDSFTETVRLEILETWISAQNFRPVDFEALWRLIGARPDTFLFLALDSWAHDLGNSHRDDMLVDAVVRSARWPAVEANLRQRSVEYLCSRWLKESSVDDEPYLPDTALNRALRKWKTTTARHREWSRHVVPLWPHEPIRMGEKTLNGGPVPLLEKLTRIFGQLPRAPYARAFAAWAVRSIVTMHSISFEQVAWVLRRNAYDPQETSTALLQEAEALLKIDHPLPALAAEFLVAADASPDTLPLLSPDLQQEITTSEMVHFRSDIDGYRALDPMQRADKKDLRIIHGTWLDDFVVSAGANDDAHGVFSTEEITCARWQPEYLASSLRELLASMATNEGMLTRLYSGIDLRQLVLGTEEREHLRRRSIFSALRETFGLPEGWIPGPLLSSGIAELPATAQIRSLESLTDHLILLRKCRHVLNIPSAADFAYLARELARTSDRPVLLKWLSYLRLVELKNLPERYTPLLALACHEDETIRALALESIARSGQQTLCAAIASTDWAHHGVMDPDESIHGSIALCLATRDEGTLSVTRALVRINPVARALMVKLHPGNQECLDLFEAFLHTSDHTRLRFMPQALREAWDETLDLLARTHADSLLGVVDGSRKTYLVELLLRALFRYRPEDASRLWHSLMDEDDVSLSDPFSTLPIEAPDSPVVEQARRRVIGLVKSDRDYLILAMCAERHGRAGWLIERITENLRARSAASVAQGITLAGMLDQSSAADDLWARELASPPAQGWLAVVHARARERYRRNQWAHHWLDRFLEQSDRDRAYGHFVLFVESADLRATVWAPKAFDRVAGALPEALRIHFGLSWRHVLRRWRTLADEMTSTFWGDHLSEMEHARWPYSLAT